MVEIAGSPVGCVQRPVVIDLEESLAILPCAPKLPPLEPDDGPGDDREQDEQQDDELYHPARLPDQAQRIEARETSPHRRPDDDAPHTSLI